MTYHWNFQRSAILKEACKQIEEQVRRQGLGLLTSGCICVFAPFWLFVCLLLMSNSVMYIMYIFYNSELAMLAFASDMYAHIHS